MDDRSDCVLIQQASGLYREMLALTVKPHSEYCLRHDIDYWPIFGETRPQPSDKPPHYDRVFLMQQAIEAGYEKIIWLDADCILNWTSEEDLRDGVPESGIGALWCSLPWTEPRHYDHWCTGTLYVQASSEVSRFFRQWAETGYEGHCWYDQQAFNRLIQDSPLYAGLIHPIERHWHAIVPHFLPEEETIPLVIAFHGYGHLETRIKCIYEVLHGEPMPQSEERGEASR